MSEKEKEKGRRWEIWQKRRWKINSLKGSRQRMTQMQSLSIKCKTRRKFEITVAIIIFLFSKKLALFNASTKELLLHRKGHPREFFTNLKGYKIFCNSGKCQRNFAPLTIIYNIIFSPQWQIIELYTIKSVSDRWL